MQSNARSVFLTLLVVFAALCSVPLVQNHGRFQAPPAVLTPEMRQKIKLQREKEIAAQDAAKKLASEILAKWRKTPAGRACKNHEDWPMEVCDMIAKRTFTIGFTEEQLRAAMGRPNEINRTVTVRGTHEQWIYGSVYVYVENGIVTSWQD